MTLSHTNIPEKANHILRLILIAFILIMLRLWYLTIIEHEQKIEESRKPQRRVAVEPARRATITDRFGLPLAINKMQYRIAILYSQFRQIPSFGWVQDPAGKKVKKYKRREYISQLAHLLANELNLVPERVEDLIYSKAALFYHLPFVLKEDLTEKEYYRLKMLEKDWLGIQVQRFPKRTYPQGKVAADIIGYMGAINREEYEAIVGELKSLEKFIREYDAGNDPVPLANIETREDAEKRLKELRGRAYAVTDSIGKAGIERRFDADLRGMQGRKSFYSDARGNFLRELPGATSPTPGKHLTLTISSQLQAYAEQLLITNESIREAQVSNPDPDTKPSTKQPWIKGGAIIVIDPNSGELLAMASHPRYDPNDFIPSGNSEINSQKQAKRYRWLENEEYLAQIWDQKQPLERECYNREGEAFEDDKLTLTWDRYLECILAPDSTLRQAVDQIKTVKQAIELQQAVEGLLTLSGQYNIYWLLQVLYPGEGHKNHGERLTADIRQAISENLEQQSEEVAKLRAQLDSYLSMLSAHYDKVLLIDLSRVAVNADSVPDALIDSLRHQNLATYRNASAAMANIDPVVRAMSSEIFHNIAFKQWRQEHGKAFIQQKRKDEKVARHYTKPYIDYLDEEERQQFQQFWSSKRLRLIKAFLLSVEVDDELAPYLASLNQWHNELIKGAHQAVSWRTSYGTLQKAVKEMPQTHAEAYLQSLRNFHELDRPLLGQYRHLRKSNGRQLEKHLAAAFYPKYGFGYGRSYAFRQALAQGSVFKLVTAYTILMQKYREQDARYVTTASLNPLTIVDVVHRNGKDVTVGYHANGTPIPQMYKGGRIAASSMKAIGNIDIVRAIETSSNPYFALVAGDLLEKPEDLINAARLFSYGSRTGIDLPSEIAGKLPTDLAENKTGLYSTAIGQHSMVVTPLQTSVMLSALANGGKVLKPQIVLQLGDSKSSIELKREIPVPTIIRNILLEGMHRVMARMVQSGLVGLSRMYHEYPEAISDYIDLKDQLAGKTSTAEAMEQIDLDLVQGMNKYTHVWFGGIMESDSKAYMSRDARGKPELVVVVYLRYGKFGKEAAPLAAQVVKFWQDLKESEKFPVPKEHNKKRSEGTL